MAGMTIKSPVGGVNRVVQREGQPPDTCWDALNVFPYDRFGRKRITQRHGMSKEYSTQISSTGNKIQGLLPINAINYAGTSTGTILTPVSTFSRIPANVSTATNNILWPTSYLPSGGDAGVVVGSTILQGSTLQFNLFFSGNSTVNASNNLYLSLNTPSTSWNQPVLGNDMIDVLWAYNPVSSTNNLSVQIQANPSTGFVFATGASTGQPPFGVAIPCSLTWAANGAVSATLGALATSGSVIVNQPASTMQWWVQNATTGAQIAASTINFANSGPVLTGQAGYQTILIAVADGFVWVGDSAGNITRPTLGQSTAQLNSTNYVSMAYLNGVVYIVDGSSTVHTYTIATSTVGILAASTGTLGGGSTSQYFLCANWRSRLVLAGDAGSPQNYYMSRAGVPNDWDYSQTDPAAAFAGNLSKSGQIGEPITALIPFSDDYLKIGCARSLWMIQGDPADGGSIVNVSQQIGIVGKDAWTVDPAGQLWFVATGGLFRVRPAWEFYRPPEAITHFTTNQNFTQLNPGTARTTLVYDPDLHYLHVFMSAPPLPGTLGQHLTLDARSLEQEGPPAFWPQQFPSTMGPTASVAFVADANPLNRTILIGGGDGFIRAWNPAALDDDGTAIASGITIGPFSPIPGEMAVLNGVTIDLGETPPGLSSTGFAVIMKLAAGPDAFSATQDLPNGTHLRSVPSSQFTTDRRQKTMRYRLRGSWFTLNLSNGIDNDFFSFESATLDFVPAGKNRERRQ